MMSLTFGLFTQVSGSGPLGPLVLLFYVSITKPNSLYHSDISKVFMFLQKQNIF